MFFNFGPLNPRITATTNKQAIMGKIRSEIMARSWWKSTFIYTLVTMAIFGLAGFGASYISAYNPYWVYVGMVILFLLLGFVHVNAIYYFLDWLDHTVFWKGFLMTLFFEGMGVLAIYLVKKAPYIKADPHVFMTATVLFTLPFVLGWAMEYWLSIPFKHYKAWYYPLNQPEPDTDLIDLSKILVISFEFPKLAGDDRYTNFTAKAPVNMSLGQLFFIFINEYNYRHKDKQLTFLDDDGNPYGWVFRKKVPWYKKKLYFDPELTFRENFVMNNDVIVATRTYYIA